MEQRLALIEVQLWFVLAGLLLLLATNIVFGVRNRKKLSTDEGRKPNFKYLWERNEIEKLLTVSRAYRERFPNSSDAHYFAIKALVAQQRFAEARELACHLAQIEPKLTDAIQEWFELIDRAHRS